MTKKEKELFQQFVNDLCAVKQFLENDHPFKAYKVLKGLIERYHAPLRTK